MIKFIVLSTQRSGSSFLCSLLDEHPRIMCAEEIFMPRNRNAITYRSYSHDSVRHRLEHLFDRRKSIESYLARLYEQQPDVDAFGFKFMYGQARRYPEVIDWCNNGAVKVVHLIRWNTLKVLVSRQIARNRGLYLSTKAVEPVTVRLDTFRLVADLQRENRLIEKYRAIFSSLPYMELYYEDVLAKRNDEIRQILSFLGCQEYVPLTSDLVKTSPDSLDKLIENYDEVRAALAGSQYEEYLEAGLTVSG